MLSPMTISGRSASSRACRLSHDTPWNWAIFAGAVTLGFGLAWRYAHQNNDTYLIVAIIAGALTVAGVITALLATFWRID